MKAHLRTATLVGFLIALDVLLFLPAALFSEAHPSALRLSFEYGCALVLLAAAARTRLRTPVRALCVVLYASLLLLLVYHHAVRHFFSREPALVEDWRLLINLTHFLGEMRSLGWIAFIVGCFAFAIALVVLVERTFAALQRRAGKLAPRRLALVSAVGLVLGGAWHYRFGSVAGVLADNYRTSVQVTRKLAQLRTSAPDRRNLPLMEVRLSKKPSFYMLMVEAYGEVLATWDMTDAYRALMARVEARLKAAGFTARTAYSAAAVHGGTSWFSIGTVHTGILVDQPQSYAALEVTATRIPTLTNFFARQGYHTLSLQPGTTNRAGLRRFDLFDHERLVDAPMLDYRGRKWGFGGIPDQFSVGTFRRQHLATTAEPRYLFFMAVSTHFPWNEVPPWVPTDHDAPWPPVPGTDKIGTDLRRAYFQSIEYEWRVLLDLLEADTTKDLVVIILGDHQPRLESNPPGELTFNAPVHVLSRDAAFVERFAEAGFQPGLFVEPGKAPALQHEGLFSLWVKKLAEAYGTPETRDRATWFPDGIGLAGLNALL